MKTRFNTYDLICSVADLQKYVGLRVNQVYDINNKTFLIRLQQTEEKVIILLESGNRIHSTEYEWPKNPAPSGFSMKLRKHLKNKRLESLKQLGMDRIVDLQFGTGEVAHHVFLELFDKGNIMLTDHNLKILYVLRPHTQGDRYRFAVNEQYPVDRVRLKGAPPSKEEISEILSTAKDGDNLRKLLTPKLEYGPALIDHTLLGIGLSGNSRVGKDVDPVKDIDKLAAALAEADSIAQKATEGQSKGYIIQKIDQRLKEDGTFEDMHVNVEFHPLLYRQHESSPHVEYDTFDKSVDSFFSSMEGQKIELKFVQQEKDALKKLENVRRDHNQRLQQLEQSKETDKERAELITKNRDLVENAIMAIRTALANQIAWPEIKNMVKNAALNGDSVAASIKDLKLETNHIILQLYDPYVDSSDESDSEKKPTKPRKPTFVDIDLDLSAYANARRYYDQKRTATKKQQKTVESQSKALKSAEKKTKKSLKEIKSIANISKARKVFWFEKFFWFISSENYLVIGGRDAIQNELVVKRYMRAGDVYVHADIHGASSILIKNPSKEPVPPKTLNEAGIMAICYSVAWEAKVITTAWWVNSDQVLKSAPAGEYLPTGSFSIRGKKNYLPPSNLILGFGFLFKLEDGSIERHSEERRVRGLEDDVSVVSVNETNSDVEVILSEDDENDMDDDDPHAESKLSPLKETEEEEGNVNAGDDSDASSKESDNYDDGSESSESIQIISEEGSEAAAMETLDQENDSEPENPQTDLYPDTEIKFHHSGKELSVEATPSQIREKQLKDEEDVVYLGDDKPVQLNKKEKAEPKKKGKGKDGKTKPEQGTKSVKFDPSSTSGQQKEEMKLKRGQRYKLKKIKEKYKDQDEEDRRLRMEFLQAVGSKKKNSKKEKKKEAARLAAEQKNKPKHVPLPKVKTKGSDGESDEEAAEVNVNDDVAVLTSLTGIPLIEDELLFAVPVIAPYTTLQNYKYKVKLTPGTGKRGKAARTALAIFLKDKAASQRERDLLKGVKDEELARNIPGKVKLSAPQLHKK